MVPHIRSHTQSAVFMFPENRVHSAVVGKDEVHNLTQECDMQEKDGWRERIEIVSKNEI